MTQPPQGPPPQGWPPPTWPAPPPPAWPPPQHGRPATGWSAPAPDRRHRRTTLWVLAGIGAALVLALVAVVLVVALRAGDDTGGGGSGDLLDSLPADGWSCPAADPDRGSTGCGADRAGPREAVPAEA